MTNICIIPAKGKSERCPNKNILDIAGKPMLYHPIRAAKESMAFNRVIVSTDSNLITHMVSKECTVHQRSEGCTSVADVCVDVLQEYKAEKFICLYATAALIEPLHIHQALRVLEKHSCVMGVTKFEIHPWKAMDKDGLQLFPHDIKRPLNGAEECYGSNGSIYGARVESFLECPDFYHDVGLIETPSVDVDYYEDYLRLKEMKEL